MLELHQVKVHRDQRDILDIDTLTLDAHQITVILGHNGSGKSTLMKLLARQLKPDSGQIFLEQRPLNRFRQKPLAQRIAYLPQVLPKVAGLTVRELVRLGRFPWRGSFGRWQKDDRSLIENALRDTAMTPFADHLVDDMSGGERQRAWVAMLLAQQSPLLLLDEPTSALDPAHQYELMQLLQQLNGEQQKGVIAIVHDINLAVRYAHRIIALKQGRIIFDGPPEHLLRPEQLRALYDMEMQVIEHPDLPAPLVAMG